MNFFLYIYRSSTVRSQVFDHVYPGTESKNNSIVVYADFTDINFKSIHQEIVTKVEEYDLKYVLRHAYEVKILFVVILFNVKICWYIQHTACCPVVVSSPNRLSESLI